MKDKILFIVDGHALIYRAYYAFISHPLRNKEGENTSAIFGFTRVLLSFIKKFNPEYLVVAFDSGKKNLRHDMYLDYKAQRKPMPDDLRPQVPVIREIVKGLGIREMVFDGYEADDIIATLCRFAVKDGLKVYIVSRDKDLSQLISDKVMMLMPPVGKEEKDFVEVNLTNAAEKFLVHPSMIPDLLALMGDSSDNIPGVKGIGEKTALKLLERYGSLEEIYENLEKVQPDSLKAKLKEQKDSAFLSKKLATLFTDLVIENHWDNFKIKEPDIQILSPIFNRYNLRSLAKELKISLEENKESYNPPLIQKNKNVDYKLIEKTEDLKNLVAALKEKKFLSVDIETDSLDPFTGKIIGISLSCEEKKAWYVAIKVKNESGIPEDECFEIIKPLLEDPNVLKIGHNTKFDSLFLEIKGIKVQPIVFDTMLASFLCDPDKTHNLDDVSLRYFGEDKKWKYEIITKDGRKKLNLSDVSINTVYQYSCEDADFTFRLYNVLSKKLDELNLRKIHDEIDLPLSKVLVEMEKTGVKIDTEKLFSLSREFNSEMLELEKKIYKESGEVFNINSTKQLQDILFNKIGLKPVKKTKTSFSTDNEVLEELSNFHPVCKLLLEYRTLSKLRNTYTDKLPELINPVTGRLHTSYNQTVAVTGRLSSINPNLQNIPVKEAVGKKIREAFVTEENMVIISADYSQIELRVLAHISEDPSLIEAFRKKEDIHERTAREVLNIPFNRKVTPEERRIAKIINFGVIYGMGAYKLSRQLNITPSEAKKHIENYFNLYKGINIYYEKIRESLEKKGFVENIFGRRRFFPDYNRMNKRDRESLFRMAINTPVQGSAADLIKIAMIKLDFEFKKRKMKTRMIIQVHDEIVLESPEEESELAVSLVKDAMESAFFLKVPLVVDINTGKNWAEAH